MFILVNFLTNPIMSTTSQHKSFSLLGNKTTGQLFIKPKFIDKDHKALYRFNRKLWGSAYGKDWKLFITFTVADDRQTYKELKNGRFYTDWEVEHQYFYDVDNVMYGVRTGHDILWDKVLYGQAFHDLKKIGWTSYIRKVFNKIQIYAQRLGYSKLTYVWIYDEGIEHSRVHFHAIIASDEIRSGSRPYWICKLLNEAWSAGKVEVQSIKKADHRETFNGVLHYINKYMSKNHSILKSYRFLETGKRRNGSSRDIDGYKPNPNVFYIHLDQAPMANLSSTNKEALELLIKFYRVRFKGYEVKMGRLQAIIGWKFILVQKELEI